MRQKWLRVTEYLHVRMCVVRVCINKPTKHTHTLISSIILPTLENIPEQSEDSVSALP